MDKIALKFFKDLMATSSPTGSEQPGQRVVANYMKRYADSVTTDINGNVHGVINAGASRRIMLAGHCDEIGLMVQHIDEKGFVYVSALGGVCVPLLPAERILFVGKNGPVRGVVGSKPIHMMTAKERGEPADQIHNLWIDIGAKNRKDAEKVLSLGDVGTIDSGWIELRNERIACRGFDDRAGAFVISDVLRHLKGKKLNVAVHAVSTVQEEIGLRGARVAAFGVDPHIGIAVDVGFATDAPGVNEKIVGTAKLGDGPILHRGPTYNNKVLDMLTQGAKKAKIKTQMQPESRGAGTDAYALQMTRSGVAAALVSIPNRYMHSPVETLALQDVANASKLIAAAIAGMTGRERLK